MDPGVSALIGMAAGGLIGWLGAYTTASISRNQAEKARTRAVQLEQRNRIAETYELAILGMAKRTKWRDGRATDLNEQKEDALVLARLRLLSTVEIDKSSEKCIRALEADPNNNDAIPTLVLEMKAHLAQLDQKLMS